MAKELTRCRWFLVELPRYLTAELETGERVRVEEHLDECFECRDSLDRFRELDHALASSLEVTSSTPEFRDSFFRRLEAEAGPVDPPGRTRWFWTPALIPLAAAAMIALVALARAPEAPPPAAVVPAVVVVGNDDDPAIVAAPAVAEIVTPTGERSPAAEPSLVVVGAETNTNG